MLTAAVLWGTVFVAGNVRASCPLSACVDVDGRGAVDDRVACSVPEPPDAACPVVAVTGAAVVELCTATTLSTTTIDDPLCGGDQDGSSAGCVGGRPNGVCDPPEFATNCLPDCGCLAAKRVNAGICADPSQSADDRCFCDPGCVQGRDCCPDACNACGSCG